MTYLFLLLLPTTIYVLCLLAYPTKNLIATIQRMAHWRLEGKPCANQRKRVKRYKTPIKRMQDRAESQMLWTYLFPAAFAAFKVGCRVESFIRHFLGPPIWDPTCLALQSKTALQTAPPLVRFILTPTLLGWITMHLDAWPMPLTYSRTCISTKTKDK